MHAEPASPATDRQPWQSAANVVSDTLRIPLAARVLGDALFAQVAVNDLHARQALQRLNDSGDVWLKDRHSVYGVLNRTRIFRELAAYYLSR